VDEQFYVAGYGLPSGVDEQRKIGLEYSICQYVVALNDRLIIKDALSERFLIGNLAVQEWGVRSYLGEPVRDTDGEVLGSFCALSYEPRDWSYEDQMILLRMTQLASAALLA
jgi:GAF domain-containing protein